VEPKDFFRVLLRRKRSVITALVAVVSIAFVLSMRQEPQYAAACKVRIAAVGPGGASQIGDDPKKNPTEIYASFEEMQQIIQSPAIAKRVASRMDAPYERIVGRINAAHEANTGIFNLTAVDRDAVFAAQLCDAYMLQFLQDRLDGATEKVLAAKAVAEARIQEFDSQIAALDAKALTLKSKEQYDNNRAVRSRLLAASTEILRDQIDLETALDLKLKGGGEVMANAGLHGVKVGPDHKRAAFLGLIMGLIFGAALALVREYMDDTVRDKEAAQRDIGLPVLASLPSGREDDPFGDGAFESIEAARMLRTNLASMGLGGDVRCIVVTSTLAKRRSETLASLAGAIAEAGRTVLVIGADFRNARVHETFGVGNAVGLTNVIRGQVTFDKAIRPVPGQVGVYVMPTGPVIGNPGELLSTEEMAMVIRRARKWADIVLIDAPPVLAAADASVLGTYADGVLLVMSAGQTLRAQATEAKEQLQAAGARVLGAVMFGASESQQAGKVLALAGIRRGGDDDDLPPLNPYGGGGGFDGGFDAGGYGPFAGSGYGGGYGGFTDASGSGAAYGGYGSYGDPYGGAQDVYDIDDDEPVRPRSRSPKDPDGKPTAKKKSPPKKIVAARPSARERRMDVEAAQAPRAKARGASNGRSAANGQAKPAPKKPSATPARRARSKGQGGTTGAKRTPAPGSGRPRRSDDLF